MHLNLRDCYADAGAMRNAVWASRRRLMPAASIWPDAASWPVTALVLKIDTIPKPDGLGTALGVSYIEYDSINLESRAKDMRRLIDLGVRPTTVHCAQPNSADGLRRARIADSMSG
jgi:hypothetical protein